MNRLDDIEAQSLRDDRPDFRPGDTVKVHVRITDDPGKERIQVFEGVVLRRRSSGASESFTVRKISNGVGVERIFPTHSPIVSKIEILNSAHVRQARLYFLRNLRGKAARLKPRRRHKHTDAK